jgi:hypothetical protein
MCFVGGRAKPVKFLSIIDAFNWIARADGLRAGLCNLQNGGMRELRVARQGSLSGADCDRILGKYHVPTHGKRVTSDHFIFVVPKQQAAWAEYILLRAGAALDGKPIEQRNAQWTAGKSGLPPAWADGKRETKRAQGRVASWLEDLL